MGGYERPGPWEGRMALPSRALRSRFALYE
jgi:hypothetical protein